MKKCIQADLDDAGAFRRINENNSERPVCIVHAPAQLVFFWVNMHHVRVFVFVCASDIEWAMSTCQHQARDSPLRTGVHSALVLHWHRGVSLPAQPCCAHNAVLRCAGSGPPLPAHDRGYGL